MFYLDDYIHSQYGVHSLLKIVFSKNQNWKQCRCSEVTFMRLSEEEMTRIVHHRSDTSSL